MTIFSKPLKRLTTPILAVALVTTIPLQASAATEGPYAAVNGGFAFVQGGHNLGYDLGAAYGYKMSELRYEGEFRYFHAGTKKRNAVFGNTHTVAFMGNAYFDFDNFADNTGINITPYLGVGLGYARVTQSAKNFNHSGNALAYQAMGGAKYDINDNVAVGLSYRYLGTTKATNRHFKASTIDASLSYRFDY